MPMAGKQTTAATGEHVDQSWLREERGQVGSCPSLSSQGWEREAQEHHSYLLGGRPNCLGLWESLGHLITVVLGV